MMMVSLRHQFRDGGREKDLAKYHDMQSGSSWNAIKPPATRADGSEWDCDASDLSACSLHLWSVSQPHNYGKIFSSSAPGFVMAVGNVGDSLGTYEEGDTFISSDAGLTWRVAQENAHKYEFGDQGAILVMIDDEDKTDHVHYSYDFGKTWYVCRVDLILSSWCEFADDTLSVSSGSSSTSASPCVLSS